MPTPAELVDVEIRQMPDGFFVASSADVPGLVLASRDVAEVLADLPEAISALYEANARRAVHVEPVAATRSGTAQLTRRWVVSDRLDAGNLRVA
jgi:predicted RNase H-like HicB family nuclease